MVGICKYFSESESDFETYCFPKLFWDADDRLSLPWLSPHYCRCSSFQLVYWQNTSILLFPASVVFCSSSAQALLHAFASPCLMGTKSLRTRIMGFLMYTILLRFFVIFWRQLGSVDWFCWGDSRCTDFVVLFLTVLHCVWPDCLCFLGQNLLGAAVFCAKVFSCVC